MKAVRCDGVVRGLVPPDTDVPDHNRAGRIDRQLGLREEVTDGAVIRLPVGRLGRVPAVVDIRAEGQAGGVAQSRQAV